MSFWTAIVIIVVVVQLVELYKARIKAGRHLSEDQNHRIGDRLDQIERRIANLETIVLEKEKGQAFDNLLHPKD